MQKRFYSITLFFCIFTLKVVAQIPLGYYNSAQGLSGTPLKTALHNIIKNHTSISYNSLWTHFQTTDKKPNTKVWDIYSDIPNGTPPYEYSYTADQCGSYNGEGDCYNREHSWPQSWFNSQTTPSSDMFHIYPTDGYVNNVRGNYPYGNVSIASYTSQNGGKLGTCTNAGYNQTAFEPIDEYKGDLARGYFYMSTRYESEDGSWNTSAATNKAEILPWQVGVLLLWSHQDPVSTKEIDRNNAIYQIQHNRNPFIDNPQWADSIWTTTITGIEPNVELSHVVVYPNPANDVFYVSATNNTNLSLTVTVYSVIGQELIRFDNIHLDKNAIEIDCKEWNKGIYYIKVSGAENKVVKFLKE